MSEPHRPESVLRARRLAFRSSGALVVGAAAIAALSAGAEARSAAIPANVSPPAIAGTAVSGETLAASSGSWTGTPPISFALTWERCNAPVANCAAITGETGQSYVGRRG